MDENGGSNYQLMETSKLWTVPYAMHAHTVDNSDDADANPENELQTLSLNGNTLSISNGNSVQLSSSGSGSSLWNQTGNGILYIGAVSVGGTFVEGAQLSVNNRVSVTGAMEGASMEMSDEGGVFYAFNNDGNATNLSQAINKHGFTGLYGANQSNNVLISAYDDDPNAGFIGTCNNEGAIVSEMGENTFGSGFFQSIGPEQTINAEISSYESAPDAGMIGVYDPNGLLATEIGSSNDNSGLLQTWGPNGHTNILLSSAEEDANSGMVGVYDTEGFQSASLYSFDDHGHLKVFGYNGSDNVVLTTANGYKDHGYIGVANSNSEDRVSIYVDAYGDGIVDANVIYVDEIYAGEYGDLVYSMQKKTNKSIETTNVYVSHLQQEKMVIARGTSKVIHGENKVILPDEFASIIDLNSLTITTTPLSAESMGLAVVEKNQQAFKVKELMKGSGSYEFDWEAKAMVDMNVVRSIKSAAPKVKRSVQPEENTGRKAGKATIEQSRTKDRNAQERRKTSTPQNIR